MATGEIEIDFGAFPGKSDASVTVTGQTNILATSRIEAWVMPAATADHTADEHMVETIKAFADRSSIVVGTSFVIKAFNTSQLNEPLERLRGRGPTSISANPTLAGQLQTAQGLQTPTRGGKGTRIYGKWMIGWAGDYA
jgi:hypothetical protein